MQIRVPQSERGKYNPGISDDHAGGPLSREDLIDLGKSMLDLAERIEVVGLAQGALAVADGLRREVNRFSAWGGYRAKDISRWDQDTRDVLLKLARVLLWCSPSSGGKHGPDGIVAELRTLGAYARKLAGAKTGQDEDSVNWIDLVRRLRTVADAYDGSPESAGTVRLASIAYSLVMDAYGTIRFEAAEGKTVEREMTDAEQEVAGLLSGIRDLLQTIIDRRADHGAGRFLRAKADSIEGLLRVGAVDAGDVQAEMGEGSDDQADGGKTDSDGPTMPDAVPDDDELAVLFILEDRETLTQNKVIGKALREEKRERAPSTVKAIIRRLLAKGWVERPRPRAGVRLTDAGKAKVQS